MARAQLALKGDEILIGLLHVAPKKQSLHIKRNRYNLFRPLDGP